MEKYTQDEFIDMWLVPAYGITLKEVSAQHREDKDFDFYETFQVYPNEHDEWYEKAIAKVAKDNGWDIELAKNQFTWAYLDVAPRVKHENN
jgi:hypothetical protein